MPNNPLDRSGFAPLYYQLVEKIKVMIDQQYTQGDLIPSETELMARYKVSRNTVRQAIDMLVRQGYVTRVQGKGTFVVSERNRYGLQKLVSFSEDMRRRGLHPDTQLLGLAKVDPPAHVALGLGLAESEQAYEIRRLRLADGEPMALGVTYLPCSLLPNLTEDMIAKGSLFELINARTSSRIAYADRTIQPVTADAAQAALLQVPEGSPLMLVEGFTFLENDQPAECIAIYYRGDRYKFAYHAVR
jgi:GntR family transcriptional regulator